jgi:hypothetical protein
MKPFRSAAFAALNGDTDVTSLLATTSSIYHNRAPRDAAFPFIIFSKNAGTTAQAFGGTALLDQMWLFKGVDRSPSASVAEDIDTAISKVLDGASLTLSSGTLECLYRDSDVDYEDDTDPDQAIHHVGGLYHVIIDPTITNGGDDSTLASLATQSIRRSGLSPAYAAATAGGDTCTPGGYTFLHVKNGGGSPVTVTVAAKEVPQVDMAVGNLVVSVPASGERMIGPIRPEIFADPAGTPAGSAGITYSAVTSVTIAAFNLSQP